MKYIKFVLWKAKNQIKKIPRVIPFILLYSRFLMRGGAKYLPIFSFTNYQERETLYNLAKSLNGGSVIVEVGSHLGATSCMLALANKNNKVYCVDTWKNDGQMPDRSKDTFEEFKNNTKDFSNIIALRGTSEEVVKNFNEKIDLLFIDGDHSYEGVKKDIFNWIPKCKDSAMVAFHDVGPAGSVEYGVTKVIDEYIKPIQKRVVASLTNLYVVEISTNELKK